MKILSLLVGFELLFCSCESGGNEARDEVIPRQLALMQTDGLIVPSQDEDHNRQAVETFSARARPCHTRDAADAVIDLDTQISLSDGEIVLRKNVSSSDHTLMAMAYVSGDEAIINRYLWQIDDVNLASFTSLASDDNRIELHGYQDLFDTDGSEPQSLAYVCAMNSCDQRVVCQTFIVTGIINLAGDWTVYGTGSTSPIEVHFDQAGRTVRIELAMSNALTGELFGNVLTFSSASLLYTCAFTSATHCNGIVVDTHMNTIVANWLADKRQTN